MRGDSLRDLYAKTLAVLGLGLLAGAGAAVDYWPVGSPVPSIGSPSLPRPDVPLLSQQLDQKIPRPAIVPAVYVRGTIHAKNVGSARFLTPSPEPARTEPAEPVPAPAASPVPDISFVVAETQWSAVISSFPAMDSQDFAFAGVMPPPAAAPSTGFIGGALRKTKDSIVSAGAVTGATIADAVKGVVGAFKKVNPF